MAKGIYKTDNFQDLLDFRMEAGDKIVKYYLENAPRNTRYRSVRTQNKIIEMGGKILRDEIVKSVNEAVAFSIFSDETIDIAEIEQISLGVRYVAQEMAHVILQCCFDFGLNLDKLVGQGYDDCSALAGKEGRAQAIVKVKYPKATFIHCSSHRLNLVIS